jgi:hypothetical protein
MTVFDGEGDAPFDTEGGLTLPATARAAGSTPEEALSGYRSTLTMTRNTQW